LVANKWQCGINLSYVPLACY